MAQTIAAYVSARVRGMKSRLMPSVEIDALLQAPDADTMTQQMLASAYEDDLAESLTRYQGMDAIEDAVTRNLVHTFQKLQRMAGGDYGRLIEIFVGRWDLAAVKALLRNRHHGLDPQTGESSLFPSPTMPAALMNELAALDSMDALVRGLAAWNLSLCRPLVDALGEYQDSRNLRVLEEALDIGYFVGNVRRLRSETSSAARFLRELLRYEIDRINLRRLFEPRAAGEEPEDVLAKLMPNGTLPENVMRDIAMSPSPERAAEALRGTAYDSLAETLASLTESARFSNLERHFETAFLAKLKRASQQQGLGLAVLMYYAWLKYNEVINIRMIARGKAVHLPTERVREELIYV